MSIPLTAELLGFDCSEGGENKSGSSAGGVGGDGGDVGGGSLLLVKGVVLQELESRRSKTALLPRERARLSGMASRIGGSFKNFFRDVQRETAEDDKNAPVTKGGEDGSTSAAAGGDNRDDATTDHRYVSADTEGWKKVNKIMLGKAVQSIPAYIERCSLVVVLVPPCKHADREGEICDESSWRGRGWCRVEYLGAALVRSDVSVMVVKDALATPEFVYPVDGLQLPPGHGTYTCCSRNHDFGGGPNTAGAICTRWRRCCRQ